MFGVVIYETTVAFLAPPAKTTRGAQELVCSLPHAERRDECKVIVIFLPILLSWVGFVSMQHNLAKKKKHQLRKYLHKMGSCQAYRAFS